ncbi:MAG: hypothetical protein ACFFCQ_04995 [Promethearchaeota archaeon]
MKTSQKVKIRLESLLARLQVAFQNEKERFSISLFLLVLCPTLSGLVVFPLIEFLNINLLFIHSDGYVYPFHKEFFGYIWTFIGLIFLFLLRYLEVEFKPLIISSFCSVFVATITISLFILTDENYQGASTVAFYMIIACAFLPFFLVEILLSILNNLFSGNTQDYNSHWGNSVKGIFSIDDALFLRQIFDLIWLTIVLALIIGLIFIEAKLVYKERAPPTIFNITRPILIYLIAALYLCPYFTIEFSLSLLH